MTFEEYQRHLKGHADALRAPETNAAFDAWQAIEKARRENVLFEAATEGTLLDMWLIRETEEKRRRVIRAHTAGSRIYELLRNADWDDELAPGDPDRLEQYVHDQLLPPDGPSDVNSSP